MPDYIQTTAEKWLTENGVTDTQVVRVYEGGMMLPTHISTLMEQFGRLIIEHAVETCDAHSDSDIDKEGAKVNLLSQFGL